MNYKIEESDRGVATLLAVGVIAAVLALASLIMCFAAAVLTRHRATNAADLAALAAAAYAPWGTDYACAQASWVAAGMNVSLADCGLLGLDAVVAVVARPPDLLAEFGTATAHARAGPASDEGPSRGATAGR